MSRPGGVAPRAGPVVAGGGVAGAGGVAPGAGWAALAFDFGGTKVEIALVGPEQQIVGRTTLRTDPDNGAEQVVERALAAGRELLAAHRRSALSAVGVASMGYTRESGVDLAPNVPGWEGLRLPTIFRRAFPGVPVVVDNDVRAAARAELEWGALAGVGTGLYVNLGTGVAATLIVHGRVVVGSHGAAGEVGYWLVPPRPEPLLADAGGRQHSTLEIEVGGVGVRARARSLGIEGGLAELMASPASPAKAAVEDVFRQIAVNVTNMAILLDPERVVLGGGYTGAGDALVTVVADSLHAHAPFAGEVVIGRFGSDAGLYGAIALAETAAAPGRSRHGT